MELLSSSQFTSPEERAKPIRSDAVHRSERSFVLNDATAVTVQAARGL